MIVMRWLIAVALMGCTTVNVPAPACVDRVADERVDTEPMPARHVLTEKERRFGAVDWPALDQAVDDAIGQTLLPFPSTANNCCKLVGTCTFYGDGCELVCSCGDDLVLN